LAERNSPHLPKDVPISLLIGSFFYFSHFYARFMNGLEHNVRVDDMAVFLHSPVARDWKAQLVELAIGGPRFRENPLAL